MGVVLRSGVALCCGVMVIGGILMVLRHGGERPSYGRFHGEPPALTTIPGVLGQAAQGSARGIIQMGALLMIATPILRVVFAVAGFAKLRDWTFVIVSLVVLGLLLFGFAK